MARVRKTKTVDAPVASNAKLISYPAENPSSDMIPEFVERSNSKYMYTIVNDTEFLHLGGGQYTDIVTEPFEEDWETYKENDGADKIAKIESYRNETIKNPVIDISKYRGQEALTVILEANISSYSPSGIRKDELIRIESDKEVLARLNINTESCHVSCGGILKEAEKGYTTIFKNDRGFIPENICYNAPKYDTNNIFILTIKNEYIEYYYNLGFGVGYGKFYVCIKEKYTSEHEYIISPDVTRLLNRISKLRIGFCTSEVRVKSIKILTRDITYEDIIKYENIMPKNLKLDYSGSKLIKPVLKFEADNLNDPDGYGESQLINSVLPDLVIKNELSKENFTRNTINDRNIKNVNTFTGTIWSNIRSFIDTCCTDSFSIGLCFALLKADDSGNIKFPDNNYIVKDTKYFIRLVGEYEKTSDSSYPFSDEVNIAIPYQYGMEYTRTQFNQIKLRYKDNINYNYDFYKLFISVEKTKIKVYHFLGMHQVKVEEINVDYKRAFLNGKYEFNIMDYISTLNIAAGTGANFYGDEYWTGPLDQNGTSVVSLANCIKSIEFYNQALTIEEVTKITETYKFDVPISGDTQKPRELQRLDAIYPKLYNVTRDNLLGEFIGKYVDGETCSWNDRVKTIPDFSFKWKKNTNKDLDNGYVEENSCLYNENYGGIGSVVRGNPMATNSKCLSIFRNSAIQNTNFISDYMPTLDLTPIISEDLDALTFVVWAKVNGYEHSSGDERGIDTNVFTLLEEYTDQTSTNLISVNIKASKDEKNGTSGMSYTLDSGQSFIESVGGGFLNIDVTKMQMIVVEINDAGATIKVGFNDRFLDVHTALFSINSYSESHLKKISKLVLGNIGDLGTAGNLPKASVDIGSIRIYKGRLSYNDLYSLSSLLYGDLTSDDGVKTLNSSTSSRPGYDFNANSSNYVATTTRASYYSNYGVSLENKVWAPSEGKGPSFTWCKNKTEVRGCNSNVGYKLNSDGEAILRICSLESLSNYRQYPTLKMSSYTDADILNIYFSGYLFEGGLLILTDEKGNIILNIQNLISILQESPPGGLKGSINVTYLKTKLGDSEDYFNNDYSTINLPIVIKPARFGHTSFSYLTNPRPDDCRDKFDMLIKITKEGFEITMRNYTDKSVGKIKCPIMTKDPYYNVIKEIKGLIFQGLIGVEKFRIFDVDVELPTI